MTHLRSTAALVALFAIVALTACTGSYYDFDGDNVADADDCNPGDPNVSPLAPDPYGDLLDTNCDGVDGVDGDGDGWAAGQGGDCDDSNTATHPEAPEVCGNGVDEDCSGLDLPADLDGDGERSIPCGGTDCDDTAASCLADCTDDDGDGSPACSDCDDADSDRFPEAEEVCDGLDTDCDGTTWHPDGETDGDADGALECEDCDDADALRHPEAVEVCNGLDDDCDPLTVSAGGESDADNDGYVGCTGTFVDRGATNAFGEPILGAGDCDDSDPVRRPDQSWYLDSDGDGFGDGDTVVVGCEPPLGHVTVAGDCDDLASTVGPGFVEVCDGQDNDCDPATAPGGGEADLDRDGWVACGAFLDAGIGLLGGSDCDDLRPDVSPGGTEVCDGLDNDCSGAADEAWDADLDGWGDCAGDCDDGDPTIFPGAVDMLGDGLDLDCDGTDVEGLGWSRTIVPAVGGRWPGVAVMPDLDGDSLSEIAVRAAEEVSPGVTESVVQIFGGHQLLGGGELLGTDALATWLSGATWSVDQALGLTDVDMDGLPDLLVQIRFGDNAIAAIPSGDVMTGGSLDLTAILIARDGGTGANFGRRIETVSDYDGDGNPDLFVMSSAGGTSACGIAHIFGSGQIQGQTGPLHPMTADFLALCDSTFGSLGGSHAEGDFDGDGVLDFAVSAEAVSLSPGSGQVGVFLSPSVAGGGARTLATADMTVSGDATWTQVGRAIASGFDIDADGLDDLVVTRRNSGTNSEEVALFLGSQLVTGVGQSVGAATSWTNLGMELTLGAAIVAVPDLDGDGVPDLAVAFEDSNVGGSGVAWLSTAALLAAPDAMPLRVAVTGVPPGNNPSRPMFRDVGDLDGDGAGDLLVFINDLRLVMGR